MRRKVEFDAGQFFREKVKPKLVELETLRKTTLRFGVFGILLGILFGIGVFGWLLAEESSTTPPGTIILGVVFGVGAAICILKSHLASQELRARFKKYIVSQIVKSYNPSFAYSPDSHIAEEIYDGSGLFSELYDRFNGDDLIVGKIGKTDFEVSEIHTEVEVRSGRSTSWRTVFEGFFFSADFHKNFSGETCVLPDEAEMFFGKWIGQGLQSMSGNLVKLENPVFEKEFVVYSTDQQEARYILSPTMMERILALKHRLDAEVRLAFVEGRVFVAISQSGNRFEPGLFGRVSEEDVAGMFELLSDVVAIVEDLNLNTRIWSK